jgi:hypothetical protein
MTIDEMYNQIKDHFSKPGSVLSKNANLACYYRLDKDPASSVRCAVGCLIPDDLYNPNWEGNSFYDLFTEFDDFGPILNIKKDDKAYDFLKEAQYDHDGSHSVDYFLDKLKDSYDRHKD